MLEFVTYYKLIDHPVLTVEREIELANLIAEGDKDAIDELVVHNIRLVAKITNELYANYSGILTPDELFSDGIKGLMRAAQKFEAGHGAKFSTYARWWIKQYIRRSMMERSHQIRIPQVAAKSMSAVINAVKEIEAETGSAPTLHEMHEKLPHLTRARILALIGVSDVMSMNATGQDSDEEIGNSIPDTSVKTPYEMLCKLTLGGDLDILLSELTDREVDVIKKRFGFYGREMTLEEISKHINRTRERVRQIQNIALKKMRKLAKKKMII